MVVRQARCAGHLRMRRSENGIADAAKKAASS